LAFVVDPFFRVDNASFDSGKTSSLNLRNLMTFGGSNLAYGSSAVPSDLLKDFKDNGPDNMVDFSHLQRVLAEGVDALHTNTPLLDQHLHKESADSLAVAEELFKHLQQAQADAISRAHFTKLLEARSRSSTYMLLCLALASSIFHGVNSFI
jgi:hypothetical protein